MAADGLEGIVEKSLPGKAADLLRQHKMLNFFVPKAALSAVVFGAGYFVGSQISTSPEAATGVDGFLDYVPKAAAVAGSGLVARVLIDIAAGSVAYYLDKERRAKDFLKEFGKWEIYTGAMDFVAATASMAGMLAVGMPFPAAVASHGKVLIPFIGTAQVIAYRAWVVDEGRKTLWQAAGETFSEFRSGARAVFGAVGQAYSAKIAPLWQK